MDWTILSKKGEVNAPPFLSKLENQIPRFKY